MGTGGWVGLRDSKQCENGDDRLNVAACKCMVWYDISDAPHLCMRVLRLIYNGLTNTCLSYKQPTSLQRKRLIKVQLSVKTCKLWSTSVADAVFTAFSTSPARTCCYRMSVGGLSSLQLWDLADVLNAAGGDTPTFNGMWCLMKSVESVESTELFRR